MVAKPPHIRSYCGTPIVLANGYRVGVLCALDTKPHAMCASSTRLMVNVAGLIAREIEGLAGADYDLPLQPKVPARPCHPPCPCPCSSPCTPACPAAFRQQRLCLLSATQGGCILPSYDARKLQRLMGKLLRLAKVQLNGTRCLSCCLRSNRYRQVQC